jgi:excisionase family DNA binding protein
MNQYIKNLTIKEVEELIERTIDRSVAQRLYSKEAEFLTRTEVCKILKITPPTLSFYTKDGTIPSYRVGARVRYKRSEILNIGSPVYKRNNFNRE